MRSSPQHRMNDMSNGPNAIKPSHVAAARLKVAIAARKGEKVPGWILELASRDLSDAAASRSERQKSTDSAASASSQRPEIDLSQERRDVVAALAAWQRTMDSGHAETAPLAAYNLGVLLQ